MRVMQVAGSLLSQQTTRGIGLKIVSQGMMALLFPVPGSRTSSGRGSYQRLHRAFNRPHGKRKYYLTRSVIGPPLTKSEVVHD